MERNRILKIFGTEYKDNTVALLKEADLKSELHEAIQRLHVSAEGLRIGIKPNLVSASEASYGATTHPEVIAGIIEYLHDNGFFNLVILEGSWVGDRTSEAFSLCGYEALSSEYNVPLIDTQKINGRKKDCAGMTVNICQCVDDIDFLINVPVLKGHCQTRITCALKNLKGLIPNSEKRRFHSMGLHKPIAHLAAAIKQDFIVVDHICGDLDFEDGGNPVVCDCIMAAVDPVLVDTWVCEELHYKLSDVPYLKMAEKLGVGSTDLSKADIRTIGEDDQKDLPLPQKVVLVEDAVQEVDSCSACYGYLIPALDRLREEGQLPLIDEKICIGQGFRGKKGALGIGNCCSEFDYYVQGCPPTEGEIYDGLKKYLTGKQS